MSAAARVYDLNDYRFRRLEPLDLVDPVVEETLLALAEMRRNDGYDPEFGSVMASDPYAERDVRPGLGPYAALSVVDGTNTDTCKEIDDW